MPLDWEKEVLPEVEALFDSASPQHRARLWEYSQAMRAAKWWVALNPGLKTPRTNNHVGIYLPEPHVECFHMLDVGGAGSPLANMLLAAGFDTQPTIVDPSIQLSCANTVKIPSECGVGIEVYDSQYPADALFCVSVLEHVENQEPFLSACVKALKPNGLLFLTMDACDVEGPDAFMFHWMRCRIYNPKSLLALSEFICSLGMEICSPVDLTPPVTPSIPDLGYSFASLAFTKL